jgi:hypothetical protein
MDRAPLVSKSSPELNRVGVSDKPVHDWYRFVLSYPPHLVREYLEKFELGPGSNVLDPFCGTGTTLVECKKLGIGSFGTEANPMAHFACQVKTDWSVSGNRLLEEAQHIAARAYDELAADGIQDDARDALLAGTLRPRKAAATKLRSLEPERMKLLLSNSISPRPLHKVLVLLDAIGEHASQRVRSHLLLALAKAVVFDSSNLHFGPEVGVLPKPKPDAPVIGPWLREVDTMARDLRLWRAQRGTSAQVFHADARSVGQWVGQGQIDGVITSPPYPNEKDYTRTTRLEAVLLGFLSDKQSLRELKQTMLRSNTRGVYKQDDDDRWIEQHPKIHAIADAIEARRIELGKTSGFERMYHRVAKLYFGGMARHFSDLRDALRPGAKLAYVVGDQASYLRVMIRTGELLAEIAESLGYRVVSIDLFRTRLATATREQLREEVLVLEWSGNKRVPTVAPKRKL